MPTYEYECSHCGHNFESFQKITDKPLSKCPKCGEGVRRLISGGSGIIFKGPGFHTTDYRKKPKAEMPKAKCNTCPQVKEGCQMNPQLSEQ
jgi:putative FmdB family regulatory protein